MRTLSVLLATAACGLFAIGCKPNPINQPYYPNVSQNNPTPNYPAPQVTPTNPTPVNPQPVNPNPINPNPVNPNPDPNPINPPQNNGGLSGTYRVDLNSLKLNLHMQQQPDQQQLEGMVAQIKQALGSLSLTLNPDGTYQATGSGQGGGGRFQLQGNTLQFQENNPDGQPKPTVTVSPDGSRLTMHMENPQMSMDVDLVK